MMNKGRMIDLFALCFLRFVSVAYFAANTSANAFTYGGRSGGRLLEMRWPSVTTASSNQSAPAFVISSLIPGVLVTCLPFRIPAEISTQPAWQIYPIGFSFASNVRTISNTSG